MAKSTEVQLIELRIAIQKHCKRLKSVTRKLEKGDVAEATKILEATVDELYDISLEQAMQAGYKEQSR